MSPYRAAQRIERPPPPPAIVVRARDFWGPIGATVLFVGFVIVMALLAIGTTLTCRRAAPGADATCHAFELATFDRVDFPARPGELRSYESETDDAVTNHVSMGSFHTNGIDPAKAATVIADYERFVADSNALAFSAWLPGRWGLTAVMALLGLVGAAFMVRQAKWTAVVLDVERDEVFAEERRVMRKSPRIEHQLSMIDEVALAEVEDSDKYDVVLVRKHRRCTLMRETQGACQRVKVAIESAAAEAKTRSPAS